MGVAEVVEIVVLFYEGIAFSTAGLPGVPYM